MPGKELATFATYGRESAKFSAMDGVDRRILAILQSEGRITFTELAARVDLSVSRCQRRVRELEACGAIRGYQAMVDAGQLGFGFEVLAFATLDGAHHVTVFDAAIVRIPQIVEAQRLFGEPDYLLRVVTANLPAYQQLYDGVLSKLPGLRGLTSTIVMKESVPRRPLPASPRASDRDREPSSGGRA